MTFGQYLFPIKEKMKGFKTGRHLVVCIFIGLALFLIEIRSFKEGLIRTGQLLENLRSTHGLVVDSFTIAQAYLSLNSEVRGRWKIGKVVVLESELVRLSRSVYDENLFESNIYSRINPKQKISIAYSPSLLLCYEVTAFILGCFIMMIILHWGHIEIRNLIGKVNLAKEKEQELKMLAHDMKGPVQVLEGLVKSNVKGDLEKGLLRSVRKLKTMTQSILENRSGEEIVFFSLSGFFDQINEICESMKEEFGSSSLSIEVAINERRFTRIAKYYCEGFDETKILRIIENLIRNGIQAQSQNPKIKLNIDIVNLSVVISVIDFGPGIPSHVLSSISQGVGLSMKKDGHGLGLLDAIQTINKLGSGFDLTIKNNEPNPGACIQLTIPTRVIPPLEKVVLIEDDEFMAMLWKIKARERGVELFHYSHPNSLYKDQKEWTGQEHFFLDGIFGGKDFLPEMVDFLLKKGLKNLYSISQFERQKISHPVRQFAKNEALDFVFS